MSSYFSRLIQQTEIAVGRSELRKADGKPPLFPPKGGGQMAEEIDPDNDSIKILATGREQGLQSPSNRENTKGITSSPLPFQSMDRQGDAEMRRTANKNISISPPLFNQDAANRNDSPPPKSASRVSLSSGDSLQHKQLRNRGEFSSSNLPPSQDVGTRLNFANTHPEVKSEKILESQMNVVQKTDASQSYQNIGSGSILLPTITITESGQDARTTNLKKLDAPQKTPKSPETFLPRQSVSSEEQDSLGESLSANPKLREPQRQPTAISKEYNPLPTRQVNLQTVREWVAGAENSKLNTQPFQFSETQPQEKHNFMLSIGTISLTVEAPPPEVQQPPLPPRKPQQEVKPVSSSSRINRHYLRL